MHTWVAVTRWCAVATGYSKELTHTWRQEKLPLTVTSSCGVTIMVFENKLLKCMETLGTMEKEVAAYAELLVMTPLQRREVQMEAMAGRTAN
jgi:hypothetical protein